MVCPYCKTTLEAHTSLQGEQAFSEGDISICAYCCRASSYTKEETLEPLDLDTLSQKDRAFVEKAIKVISKNNDLKNPNLNHERY